VFDLAGQIGSEWFYFFPWRQGQHREKDHASPCQETEGCSDEARAHGRRLSELDGFGKSGPGGLAPLSLTHVPAQVAGAVLEAGGKADELLAGKREARHLGQPFGFRWPAPCSAPDRAATDPCLCPTPSCFGRRRLLNG
jgi:hypothetical protein